MTARTAGWRFPGWRMVAVAVFVDFVAVGFFFYSYGVFFKAIAAEFGGSRLGVSIGLTITSVIGSLAAPLVGRALDRYPLSRVLGVGAVSMTIGFLVLGFVRTPLEFYLAIGVFIGLGASAMGSLATAKLVANWFVRRRGMALGIAATGISVSGVLMPYISAAIIEGFGWREGFLIYAGFTGLLVVPLVSLLVISRPEDIGLRPDGQLDTASSESSEEGTRAAAREDRAATDGTAGQSVLRERNYWVLVVVVGLLFSSSGGTLPHMVPRLTDAGVSLAAASLVMSFSAVFGILGKLSFGWFGDWWRGRTAIWLAIVCQIIGQVVMALTIDVVFFALGAAIFGYGMGGVVPLQGALVGKLFGRDRFGKAMGAMRPAMLPLQVLGVPAAGFIFDTTGSYDGAYVMFLVFYLLAAIAAFFFVEPNRPGRKRAAVPAPALEPRAAGGS